MSHKLQLRNIYHLYTTVLLAVGWPGWGSGSWWQTEWQILPQKKTLDQTSPQTKCGFWCNGSWEAWQLGDKGKGRQLFRKR